MTRDQECVRFLQWALPRLGYRWGGFRKVRRQVCRRVQRRFRELELSGFDAYRQRLESDPGEWPRLDACCRITISRFYRDRRLWEVLADRVLPELYRSAAVRDPPRLSVWSAGCGAGEEPYTLALLLRLGANPLPDGVHAEIVATDLDSHQLERAAEGVYPEASLRDLPDELRERGFAREDGDSRHLAKPYLESVRFVRRDIREDAPAGPFDLVLCRNLVFTYFDGRGQIAALERLLARLRVGGYLALGSHESLPAGQWPLAAGAARLYRRVG